ncbi:MAG: response regulator [Sideroxydans sp.]|nr:response regulator [Sideroxydans sp.]
MISGAATTEAVAAPTALAYSKAIAARIRNSFEAPYLIKIMQINTPPRVLLVDSSQHDAQQVLDKLEAGGYQTRYWPGGDPDAMKTVLASYAPDIILCSYDLPALGGLHLLKLTKTMGQDIPFLFLCHDTQDKNINRAMQAGADDYLCKSDLSRLAFAIEHNLREAKIRRAHNESQATLQENQARLSAFISNLPGMAYQMLLAANGGTSFPYVSEGSWALLGLGPQELEKDAALFLNMIHQDDRPSYDLAIRLSAEQSSFWNWEGRISMPVTGEIKWINLRCSPRRLNNGSTQWEGVMFNITQSKAARIELDRSREELRALSQHVQDVREQERLNISREVHDNLGGILTAIKLEVVRMNNHLTAENRKVTEISKGIEELVDKCIIEARNISLMLRPGVLDCFGIVAAIEVEIEEFRKRTGIQCEFTNIDEREELDPELDIALFRIFQETLTNIIKHAQATRIKIDIRNQQHEVALMVSDNGRGLAETDKHKPHSFGLRGIQERITYFGGKLKISSAAGQGTSIAITIPRNAGTIQASPQRQALRDTAGSAQQ